MKISIITVCKNAVDSIENTLLSIYGQTYNNIEHIIIDGVSTDGTLEILEKYKDKITYFVSEPDTGIYNAMNKGIKVATGDILYFLNATDFLYDETVLETVVKEFKKHQDLKILWGKVQFIENKKDTRVLLYDDINLKYDFIYRNPCHQVVFYKNEVFQKYGGYDERFPIYADYDFNLRMLVIHNLRCKYIPKFLARFELGGISTSTEIKYQNLQKKEKIKIHYSNIISSLFFSCIYLNARIDRFFMKFLGTPTKFVKKTKLWAKFFDKNSDILPDFFKLNMIQN